MAFALLQILIIDGRKRTSIKGTRQYAPAGVQTHFCFNTAYILINFHLFLSYFFLIFLDQSFAAFYYHSFCSHGIIWSVQIPVRKETKQSYVTKTVISDTSLLSYRSGQNNIFTKKLSNSIAQLLQILLWTRGLPTIFQ